MLNSVNSLEKSFEVNRMVSVIINNYNYEKFLREAIESVLNQTYKDWELIIIDDGSTDNSIKIIDEYVTANPEKIRGIYKQNGGQASCFNVGFEETRGDIIAFLDSDDYWFPEKLERIVKAHIQHPFVVHDKQYSKGNVKAACLFQNEKRSYYLRKYGIGDTYDITTSTISFSMDLAKKIFPMPEKEFRVCADHYAKFAALYYSNIHFIEEKLSCYRIHGNNLFVELSSKEKTSAENILNYVCTEYLNQRLIQNNQQEPLVPQRCPRLTDELLKEAGEGFEIHRGQRYVIYGTGYDSSRMTKFVTEREAFIVAYVDSSKEKQKENFYAKTVWDPTELPKKRNLYDKIIIASMRYYDEMVQTVDELGFERGKDYIYSPIF